MGQHHWTPQDDLVAFYLYRYGTEVVSLEDVERKLGISSASMKMRMANFKALDGQGGLGNVSRQSQQVYAANRSAPREELERAVLEILDRDVPRSRSPPSRRTSRAWTAPRRGPFVQRSCPVCDGSASGDVAAA